MEIKETRILARASYSYNVGEVEMTVSNATDEELKLVEKQCILEASKIAKSLAQINDKEKAAGQPQVQVQRTPTQPKPQQNQFPAQRPMPQGYSQPIQTRGQYTPKMATQAQLSYLHGLGYSGPTEGLTSKKAIELIQSLKAQQQMGQPQPGYNDPNMGGYDPYNY